MSRFDELLSKEMTRRQFLVAVGLGIVSIFGLSTIMGVLTGGESSGRKPEAGYGVGGYGR